MRPNHLKVMCQRQEAVVNGWLGIPSSYAAEVMGHQGFDVFRTTTVTNQRSVRGLNHNQIVNPQRCQQAVGIPQQAVLRIQGNHFALRHIILGIFFMLLVDGIPAA